MAFISIGCTARAGARAGAKASYVKWEHSRHNDRTRYSLLGWRTHRLLRSNRIPGRNRAGVGFLCYGSNSSNRARSQIIFVLSKAATRYNKRNANDNHVTHDYDDNGDNDDEVAHQTNENNREKNQSNHIGYESIRCVSARMREFDENFTVRLFLWFPSSKRDKHNNNNEDNKWRGS